MPLLKNDRFIDRQLDPGRAWTMPSCPRRATSWSRLRACSRSGRRCPSRRPARRGLHQHRAGRGAASFPAAPVADRAALPGLHRRSRLFDRRASCARLGFAGELRAGRQCAARSAAVHAARSASMLSRCRPLRAERCGRRRPRQMSLTYQRGLLSPGAASHEVGAGSAIAMPSPGSSSRTPGERAVHGHSIRSKPMPRLEVPAADRSLAARFQRHGSRSSPRSARSSAVLLHMVAQVDPQRAGDLPRHRQAVLGDPRLPHQAGRALRPHGRPHHPA